jgi:hypothetical protein
MLNAVIGYRAIQPSLHLSTGIFLLKSEGSMYRITMRCGSGDKGKGKVVPLLNETPYHEDIWGNGS